jgi:LacI family transcriptional regulator, galactose operon repressor
MIQRPTLKTIAAEMDLSVSAVSRIINGKGKSIGLNDNTIKNTLAYADKVGYRPHKQAQNLRLGKTNTIGVMLFMPESSNSDLTYRLFKGISETAQEKSQTLMFFDVSEPDSGLKAINKFLNLGVDGIIATHLSNEAYLKSLKKIIAQGINVVMVLDPSSHFLDCPNIIVDEQQGGIIATEYLIQKGYKRIAHLSRIVKSSSGMERFKGYKKALASAGIPYDEQLVIEDNEGINFNGAREILKLKELPDAIFCWSDRSAVRAQHILSAAGLKIEIVGFDNREFIQYLEEPFSSIDFPLQKVGATAVETLLSGDLSKRVLAVTPEIVNR